MILSFFRKFEAIHQEKSVEKMKKIVLFASGNGTNAENIMAFFSHSDAVEVAALFCNNKEAKVLEKASKFDVPTHLFSKEELNSETVLTKLLEINPDLIVLAGFLLKFPAHIVAAYPDKIINIHPALLPKYGGKGMYGMHVHQAVVENKEPKTGITIHYVDENYDEGNIIFQKEVTVLVSDTPEVVAAKIHELEQDHFPAVIEKLLTNL